MEDPQFLFPERSDYSEPRKRILSLSNPEAKKIGIRKNELWYLRQKAKSDKPFKVYNSVSRCLVSKSF
jgi:hypothetical protein